MSQLSHSRPIDHAREMSGLPLSSDVLRRRSEPTRWANFRHNSHRGRGVGDSQVL
jgi:hypothetical protein